MMSRTPTVPRVEPEIEKRLHRAAEMIERSKRVRDAAIVDAYLSGAGLREIARAVDLSHPGVKSILDRYEENPELMAEHIRRRDRHERVMKARRAREEEWRNQQK